MASGGVSSTTGERLKQQNPIASVTANRTKGRSVNEQHKNNGWPSRDEIVGVGPTDPVALAREGYQETVRAMDLIIAPGQVREPHVPGVSTLYYRRPSLKEMRAKQTPEQKRVVAYHEAGHAAMMFMFRMHYNIVSIDMRVTLAVTGEVRTAEPDAWIPVILRFAPRCPKRFEVRVYLGRQAVDDGLPGWICCRVPALPFRKQALARGAIQRGRVGRRATPTTSRYRSCHPHCEGITGRQPQRDAVSPSNGRMDGRSLFASKVVGCRRRTGGAACGCRDSHGLQAGLGHYGQRMERGEQAMPDNGATVAAAISREGPALPTRVAEKLMGTARPASHGAGLKLIRFLAGDGRQHAERVTQISDNNG